MAVNEALAERVRAAAMDQTGRRHLELREKHMFGGLAFMFSDKMACGVVGDDLMVRVGTDAYDVSLRLPHARPMDFTGRPMRGYVFIDADGCGTQAAVARWVTRAAIHIEELISNGPSGR